MHQHLYILYSLPTQIPSHNTANCWECEQLSTMMEYFAEKHETKKKG